MESWFLSLVLSVGSGSDMQTVTIQMPSEEACELAREKAIITSTTVQIGAGHSRGSNETLQEVSLRDCFYAPIANVERWRPGDPSVVVDDN